MKIDDSLVNSILNIDWLCNCGTNKEITNEMNNFGLIIGNKNTVLKNIEKISWENICLEERNDFTGYMAANYRNNYKNWNVLAIEIKNNVIPKVENQIKEKLLEYQLPDEVIHNIRMDIVSMIMLLSNTNYYNSIFYDNLFKIYQSGHLPCGWKGKYPEGKIMIY